MLVLAMQFSKGTSSGAEGASLDGRTRLPAEGRHCLVGRVEVGLAADALTVPPDEATSSPSGVQRTQRTEETTARRTLGDREENLRPINDELDGHQCTNWESVRCWYRTMDSLERR
jgi:hypothetical protein